VRAIGELESTGIELGALAKALASGHLTLGYMEAAVRRLPRSDRTFEQLGETVGVPFATLERLYVAFGLPRPAPDEKVRMEDLEALRILPVLTGAGVEEVEILRMARVWGDSMRRAAQYLPHYFHATVEDRFRQRGLRDNEALDAAIAEVGVRIGQSGEDLLGWLFRRHSEVFQAAHRLEHVETALDDADVRARPVPTLEAAVFADLSGFTQLTEAAGDQAAAEMGLTLAQLAGEVASRHDGSVVKLLGDGVLLHFANAADALRASLDLLEAAPSRGLPPTHIGANAGPMLYEQGDFFGRTVNVAARLAARADPGQVLVGEALARLGADGVQLREVGPVELKGITQPVLAFEAVRA
jgi:class 3 adenylate cyclase